MERLHARRGHAGGEGLADRPFRGDRGARASRVRPGNRLPCVPRRGGDPPELPQYDAVPVDRPADHPPIHVRRVVGDPRVGEERVVPQHRPRLPAGGEPERVDAPGGKPDPLEAAAQRRHVVLPAGQALQVGRLDLHRRQGGLVPAARGPGEPSGRQHQGDQEGGRRADPGADRRFVARADLDAGNRGKMPQGAGEKTHPPTEGETVGVDGGDRDPEISRGQPCRAAPERAHRDLAAHRDGRVHRHRAPDQEVQRVDVEGPPRDVHAVGDHHPEGAEASAVLAFFMRDSRLRDSHCRFTTLSRHRVGADFPLYGPDACRYIRIW